MVPETRVEDALRTTCLRLVRSTRDLNELTGILNDKFRDLGQLMCALQKDLMTLSLKMNKKDPHLCCIQKMADHLGAELSAILDHSIMRLQTQQLLSEIIDRKSEDK